jgi:outer membrane protein assembly factor BamB/SAM-dependent methyltransferase
MQCFGTSSNTRWRWGIATAVLLSFGGRVVADDTQVETLAARILQASGVRGGVVVHLGCGDGRLSAALRANEAFAVQGWDTDAANVAAAREYLLERGVYGPVAVDRWTGPRLPYIDNFVNLLVVDRGVSVDRDEMLRVLCPDGVAVVLSPGDNGGMLEKLVKPRPDTIDDWTHYLYDARGNAVSNDAQVGPPRRLQWVGGPRYARHHDRMSSVSAVVSAGGRVFSIVDEALAFSILTPPEWKLVARDAFNGTVLWKRTIDHWHTQLWPLKSGPAQLPRRLVSDGRRVFVTLGLNAPLMALDAATGETIRTYESTTGTEEILLAGGVLYLLVSPHGVDDGAESFGRGYNSRFWDELPRRIVAVRADSGRVLWDQTHRVLPGTLAADSQRVVFHDGESVVCLDQHDGRQQWRSEPVERVGEIRAFYIPILVLHEDVVLFSGGETAGTQTGSWYREGKDTMTALSIADGRVLWTAHHPPSGYRSPEDLLVVDGLVWTGETTSGRAEGLFTGRDVHTGQVENEFVPDVDTYWFHHRCYRGKATCNYLLMSRTGIELIDLRQQTWEPHHWVRGACLYGIMPANGLIYAPQHPCACYLEAKLDGFNALATAGDAAIRRAAAIQRVADTRLERGPAFARTREASSADDLTDQWPTYRRDAARSGRTPTTVPTELTDAWQTDIGGRLTSPVIADGRLYVASVDRHTVYALDAATGRSLWRFTSGGRVDSPPTIHRGLVLFGSADGHVYAVNAADGQLAWRFRAAPMDERMMSFEQIESVWPVHGSVLIQDDVLYCVAGRSMFVDGGLRLWRLEPETGRVLSETVMDETDPAGGKDLQDYVSWLNMPAGLPDILSSDGRLVYMRGQPFHLDGQRLPLEAMPTTDDADRGAPPAEQDPQLAHLFSPTGFLDDTGWHRTYWLYGNRFVSGWAGYHLAGKAAPAGRILVFDDQRVYGFGRKPQYFRWTTPIEHHLFAAEKHAATTPEEDRRSARETRVRVPKTPGLNPGGTALAVAAWVRADKPDGVVLARGGGVHGYALFFQGGRPHFAVRSASELGTAVAEHRAAGRWVHLTGVLTADKQAQLYVDGKLAATAEAPGLIEADPNEAMEIGADDGSTVGSYVGPLPFDGAIGEVRIFHGNLTADEIAALASDTSVATCENAELVLAYSFDGGQAHDASGHDHHGTVEGAEAAEGKVGQALAFVGGPTRVRGYGVALYWTEDLPLWARALVLADGVLFVAGPPDLVDEEDAFRRFNQPPVQEQLAEQAAAFAGQRGGLMHAVSATDGRILGRWTLDAPPVFDGMAAADGRLYLTTEAGQVICFTGPIGH